MTFYANSPEDLAGIAPKILELLGDNRLILFYGDMGAGKTTLIKAICEVLGVTDVVSSPTFSIINEYNSPAGPIFHFDFYRIESEEEALDIGCEEYFYSGHYCFLEWPENIAGLLPDWNVNVSIGLAGTNQRIIIVENQR